MRRRGSDGRPPRRQILVFTEGKITEPSYLAAWARRVRAHTMVQLDDRTGRDPKALVEMAVAAKRADARDERRGRGRARDEYWCVFDVDEHARLREALELARAHGIDVAVSNPNFELWLLLHQRNQTAALTKDDARRAVRDEMGIDKSLSPAAIDLLHAGHAEAVARASALDAMHARNGTDGNPSTGVPRLIERLTGSP